MNYYDLEQTLEIFQNKLPEKVLPFGIKQLADLCRRENITPVFSYDKVIVIKEKLKHEDIGLTTFIASTSDFKGYLTLPNLINLLSNHKPSLITASSAYIYEHIGSKNQDDDRGNLVHFKTANYNITIDDLLFPNEQIQRYIQSEHGCSLSTPENLRITELESQLKQTEARIEAFKKQSFNRADDYEDLNPKTLTAVTSLLNVLFHKANYDISSHAGTTNTNIVEFSKQTKTPITKNTVSKWIKEVQQLRIDVKKKDD